MADKEEEEEKEEVVVVVKDDGEDEERLASSLKLEYSSPFRARMPCWSASTSRMDRMILMRCARLIRGCVVLRT